jgi:hypothetical protein
MMFKCEVTPQEIKRLIYQHIASKLGADAEPKIEDIFIKVRSKQNYRNQEWENGELMVTFEGEV